jgi:phage N-6-adenine-methyltransferase
MAETTWETPQQFFNMLNDEFNFVLDVAALPGTAKCEKYFTPEVDALRQDWDGTFWMNPPYGRGQNVYAWVKKAYESAKRGAVGVCLLPVSGDTKWFHDFCLKADEIRFVKDRLWFSLNGVAQRANHASMVVIFKPVPGKLKISTVPNCRER